MKALPRRFNSWNKFLSNIEEKAPVGEEIKTVLYDNIEYNMADIQAEALKELRNALPDHRKYLEDLDKIRYYFVTAPSGGAEIPQWLYDLNKII